MDIKWELTVSTGNFRQFGSQPPFTIDYEAAPHPSFLGGRYVVIDGKGTRDMVAGDVMELSKNCREGKGG